jgi:hypothetical protein
MRWNLPPITDHCQPSMINRKVNVCHEPSTLLGIQIRLKGCCSNEQVERWEVLINTHTDLQKYTGGQDESKDGIPLWMERNNSIMALVLMVD